MRLFVAVWPSPEVVDGIAAFPRPEIDGLRWTAPDQWHVTMRFLGECDETAALDALEAVDGRSTVARMGPTTGRFGWRIVHVPVAGLDALAAAVADATGGIGRPLEDRVFHGHLTLARVRDTRRRPPVDIRPLADQPLAGEWPVNEVTLVQSKLGPGGARYEVVARRSLVD